MVKTTASACFDQSEQGPPAFLGAEEGPPSLLSRWTVEKGITPNQDIKGYWDSDIMSFSLKTISIYTQNPIEKLIQISSMTGATRKKCILVEPYNKRPKCISILLNS